MGQRTAIILQVRNKNVAKYMKCDGVETRVFYHSWGIGRVMPSQLLAIINGLLSVHRDNQNVAKALKPQGCTDITDDYSEQMGVLNSINFDRPALVGEILQSADNNNGGLFVRVSIDERANVGAIEYAYMLGYEEDGDYKRFCSSEEWFAKAGFGYIDDGFVEIYEKTLRYHNAVERKDGEVNV